MDPEIRAALRRLLNDLERVGCLTKEIIPPGFAIEAAWETWSLLFSIEAASIMPPGVLEAYATDPKVAADPFIRRGVERAASGSMAEFAAGLATRDDLAASVDRLLGEWDILLCPVTPTTALAHCPTGTPVEVGDRQLPYWTGGTGFTNPFNLTGHPVVVLPVVLSSEGLPIGLQLVGKRWCEMALLAMAEKIDLLTPELGAPPN